MRRNNIHIIIIVFIIWMSYEIDEFCYCCYCSIPLTILSVGLCVLNICCRWLTNGKSKTQYPPWQDVQAPLQDWCVVRHLHEVMPFLKWSEYALLKYPLLYFHKHLHFDVCFSSASSHILTNRNRCIHQIWPPESDAHI